EELRIAGGVGTIAEVEPDHIVDSLDPGLVNEDLVLAGLEVGDDVAKTAPLIAAEDELVVPLAAGERVVASGPKKLVGLPVALERVVEDRADNALDALDGFGVAIAVVDDLARAAAEVDIDGATVAVGGVELHPVLAAAAVEGID